MFRFIKFIKFDSANNNVLIFIVGVMLLCSMLEINDVVLYCIVLYCIALRCIALHCIALT